MHIITCSDADIATILAAIRTVQAQGFLPATREHFDDVGGEFPTEGALDELAERLNLGNSQANAVLTALADAIDATGGVIETGRSGTVAPAADPTWPDLGSIYLDACAVLDRQPHRG
jgi:hypothetical protein